VTQANYQAARARAIQNNADWGWWSIWISLPNFHSIQACSNNRGKHPELSLASLYCLHVPFYPTLFQVEETPYHRHNTWRARALIEADSNDALFILLAEEPYGPFLEFSVTPLSDINIAYESAIKQFEQMIGE